MKKGFLIYEEMRKYLVIYEEAVSHIYDFATAPFWISLKVPKREIFVTELSVLSHPIWIGDLRTKAKNQKIDL